MKNRATSYLTPMAAKTMTNGSSEVRIFDWRTICAASLLCGRPLPEKIGSFCPRMRVFIPSMQEMPGLDEVLGIGARVRIDGHAVDVQAAGS